MTSRTTARVLPIRFHRLFPGSMYNIFAEPSRGIRKSDDKRVYIKVCDAYSIANGETPERAIILFPEDLVIPLSKGE